MPASRKRERTIFVNNLAVLKEAGFFCCVILRVCVPVEEQRNIELPGKLNDLWQENRIAVIGDNEIGIAMVQMPVERFEQFARRILFQRVRAVVVADFQLQILLVLRRHEIVTVAELHNGKRRQFVFKCFAVVGQMPGEKFAVAADFILTQCKGKKLCFIQKLLLNGNIRVKKRKVRKEFFEVPYDFFKPHRVMHKYLQHVDRICQNKFLCVSSASSEIGTGHRDAQHCCAFCIGRVQVKKK